MRPFLLKIKSKKKLFLAIIAYTASLIAIWSGISHNSNSYQYILAIISTLLLAIVILVNLIEILKTRVYKIKDEESIALQMSKLYDSSGYFIISSTGSMEWVKYHNILEKLRKKAAQNNLLIFIPKENEVTNKLKEAGARIIDYNDSGFRPSSNFSIIRPESPDSMIAIGRQFNEYHVIEEYHNNETIMFLVSDIQKLLNKISEK